jgi:hypothetical protein
VLVVGQVDPPARHVMSVRSAHEWTFGGLRPAGS